MSKLKKIVIVSITFLVLSLSLIFFADYQISSSTANATTSDINLISPHKVGLLLGTSKYSANGKKNLYFIYRIQAALELYQNQKIEYLIISGDNSRNTYNEPQDMKDELVAKGIPAEKIFLDYAGFRTLDSVVRAKEIFGQDSIIIISQEFHNQRAIYLAKSKGIDAIGYNAKAVGLEYGIRVQIREKIARVKAFYDILLGVEPKFLGEKINIE